MELILHQQVKAIEKKNEFKDYGFLKYKYD